MKRLFFFALSLTMMTLISAAPLLAGDYKTVATAPPPPVYGTGFYGAIDMGANVYQNRGGDQTFTDEFDDTLTISPKNDVGFYGGIKLGYVFGTGKVRFVLEEDMFYNGFRGGADTTLNLDGDIMRSSSGTTFINTGAFMTNFMVKFGNGPFQFYFGGGVGAYFAESAGFDLNTPNHTFSTGGGGSHADLAWQVIVGADYYFTPKWSTFIEYHYLDYTSSNINTINDRDLGQHLVGAGIRFHF